jgi:hypothetical protein
LGKQSKSILIILLALLGFLMPFPVHFFFKFVVLPAQKNQQLDCLLGSSA